jgi:SAM-dependent methyltransferase
MEDDREVIRQFELHGNVLQRLGRPLRRGSTVLDFGCGEGRMVNRYAAAGYAAYGCDIALTEESEHVRAIETHPYRLPFSSDSFDFVVSDQVFEHVQDYGTALSEIRRVLKPAGVSLHFFPSRWRPLESHVFAPFAGALQGRMWLGLWAAFGIRNEFQRGMSAQRVARVNHEFLRSQTNYLPKTQIAAMVGAHFPGFVFAERHMMRHTFGRARLLAPLAERFPAISRLYGAFAQRVLSFSKEPTETGCPDSEALGISPVPATASA